MGYLQKEGLQPNPEAPKTILDRNSAYKLRTKTVKLPKLRTFKVRAPTLCPTNDAGNQQNSYNYMSSKLGKFNK